MRRSVAIAASVAVLGVALVGAGPGTGSGSGTGTGKPASALRIPHTRFRLPNGLEVIVHADRRVPRVVVDVLYRVGARFERAKHSGMAHLFEHLMFMGTKRIPEK